MELKQAIVVRTDLEMGRGKIAAQASHASLAAYLKARKSEPETAQEWVDSGMKKVALKAGSKEELIALLQKAKDAGLPCAIIEDAGHTQLEPGTMTCVGIGPAGENAVDAITGKLKLL
jgi:peptidyl-tRNA hydrolase, PTH2 family